MRAFLLAVGGLLLAASYAVAEEATKAVAPAPGGTLPMGPAPGAPVPQFQAYIFWAYGLACLLIFLFTLWTVAQVRRVEGKVDYLTRTSSPGRADSKSGGEG